jgi:hypothetical protein
MIPLIIAGLAVAMLFGVWVFGCMVAAAEACEREREQWGEP